ncbi:transcription factor bHLH155-like [Quercus lobata]|uniref:transcription factor bHLH155-like n=1 Tax=Quercus lobata TaxID=97700 RepID=UPI001245B994|nr:transcription factor bHLH155-like [Quercus lobata]
MGSTALRQFLKSLCSNSHWKYAVFWKLMHHGQLILTWEDGYCDYPKPIEPVENISDDIYFKVVNEIWSSSCETNTCNDGSGGYPIGLAVNDMSCHHYPMGEGVVGEVAFTGSHSWILFENNLTSEFNYNLVPECPDEWLLQFAAGIKTILLVPVLPHGVLQLGSLEPKSSPVSRNRGAFNGSSASVSFNSIRSTLIDEVQQQKDSGCMQPRKGTKPSNVGKRRARAAENQRQRPRDRQMIQDRVKELRQLVPNSAKCSIDGLLDRAVKHMLHLRSVTKHAEKLRQYAHHEVANHNNWVSPETKNVSQNGTSWAFDFGTELQICPIVVEDLEFPGQMLIEMLCDEHGLFLEIAEVIRGAELTILKGTMDLRSNKTWAHFIVEGPRGFHRMDIFWPLMHLWQRKRKPMSSRI